MSEELFSWVIAVCAGASVFSAICSGIDLVRSLGRRPSETIHRTLETVHHHHTKETVHHDPVSVKVENGAINMHGAGCKISSPLVVVVRSKDELKEIES